MIKYTFVIIRTHIHYKLKGNFIQLYNSVHYSLRNEISH